MALHQRLVVLKNGARLMLIFGMSTVDSNSKTARLAGLLYLVTVMTGVFSLMYVPSQISGHGDAAATVNNIVNSELLFRLGIAAGSLQYVAFLLLPLVLYKLLAPVNKNVAILMVALAVASVPIDLMAVANQFDILSLLNNDNYQTLLTSNQLHAEAKLLLDSYYNKILVAEILWGLWLFPFGYLVFRSGFLPKILGVLLMIGCFSYLIAFFGQTLFPHYTIPDFVMFPVMVAEIGTCLWLLVVGARKASQSAG